MKRKLFLFTVVVLMMIMLVSCDLSSLGNLAFLSPPQTADELWERIDNKMTSVDAYQVEVDTDLELHVGEYSLVGSSAISEIAVMDTEGRYTYYYQDSSYENYIPELNERERGFSLTAYDEGKIYLANTDADGKGQSIVGDATVEEFYDFVKSDSIVSSDLNDCESSEFRKLDGGGWEYVASGFSSDAINEFAEAFDFGSSSVFDGFELADMNLTVKCNRNYLVEEMNVEFVFSSDDARAELPKVNVNAKYTAFGKDVKKNDSLRGRAFSAVDNIILIDEMLDMMYEREEAEYGEFTLNIVQTLSVSEGYTGGYTLKETDTVTYGVESDEFYYDLIGTVGGTAVSMEYRNGMLETTQGGSSSSGVFTDQTESEAKRFIAGLINSAKFSESAVTAIEVSDAGVYTFTCNNVTDSTYKNVFSGSIAQFESATQTVTFTVKDGKIKSIVSNVLIRGILPQGSTTLSVESTVTFNQYEKSN